MLTGARTTLRLPTSGTMSSGPPNAPSCQSEGLQPDQDSERTSAAIEALIVALAKSENSDSSSGKYW